MSTFPFVTDAKKHEALVASSAAAAAAAAAAAPQTTAGRFMMMLQQNRSVDRTAPSPASAILAGLPNPAKDAHHGTLLGLGNSIGSIGSFVCGPSIGDFGAGMLGESISIPFGAHTVPSSSVAAAALARGNAMAGPTASGASAAAVLLRNSAGAKALAGASKSSRRKSRTNYAEMEKLRFGDQQKKAAAASAAASTAPSPTSTAAALSAAHPTSSAASRLLGAADATGSSHRGRSALGALVAGGGLIKSDSLRLSSAAAPSAAAKAAAARSTTAPTPAASFLLPVKLESGRDSRLPLGPSKTDAALAAAAGTQSPREVPLKKKAASKRSFKRHLERVKDAPQESRKEIKPSLSLFESSELNERVDVDALMAASSGLLRMRNSMDFSTEGGGLKLPSSKSSIAAALGLAGPAAAAGSSATPSQLSVMDAERLAAWTSAGQYANLLSAMPHSLSTATIPMISSIGDYSGMVGISAPTAAAARAASLLSAPTPLASSLIGSLAAHQLSQAFSPGAAPMGFHLPQHIGQLHSNTPSPAGATLGAAAAAQAAAAHAATLPMPQATASSAAAALLNPTPQPLSSMSSGAQMPASPDPSMAKKPEAGGMQKQQPSSNKGPRKPRKTVPENKIFVQKSDLDVLFGRGGESNYHPGNKRYRLLVEENKPRYLSCDKSQKTQVAQSVVDEIHGMGGRFLDKDKDSGNWYVALNKVARTKVGQALRDRNTPEARAARRAKYGC